MIDCLKKNKNVILINLFIALCYLIILTVIEQIGIDNILANTYLYNPRLTFFQTIKHIYNRAIFWNLRIGELVYFTVGAFPKYIFYLISSINFIVLNNLIIFYTFGKIKVKHYFIFILFSSIFLFTLTPAFSEIFLWEAGCFNQFFDTIIILIAGIPFRYLQENKNIFKNKKRKLILYFTFFFIAGFSTENIVPTLIVYMIISTFIYFKKNKKIIKWPIFATIVTSISFLIMITSKSTKIRINSFDGLKWAIITKNKMFENFFKHYIILILLMIIFTIIYIVYCKKKKISISSKLYNILLINFTISFIALFSQIFGKYFEVRSILIIAISFYNIFIYYLSKFLTFSKKYIKIILILQLTFLLIYSISLRYIYLDYNKFNILKEKYINKQKINNNKNIKCPRYDNKYNIIFFEYKRLFSFQFLYCDKMYLNYKYYNKKNEIKSVDEINIKLR